MKLTNTYIMAERKEEKGEKKEILYTNREKE
jgi:hypothetical protein